jgi:hypothetical protein
MKWWRVAAGAAFAAGVAAGCDGVIGGDGDADSSAAPKQTVAAEPAIARLSRDELANSWRALFGAITLPTDLPGDDQLYGFSSIAQARSTISPLDLEKYETATYGVLAQVFDDATKRAAFVGCTPATAMDACAKGYLAKLGRRVWRRSLTEVEIANLVAVSASVSADLGDIWEGLRYASAAVLLSPNFLFRVDIGKLDSASGQYRYTSLEMASRLSFLILDAPPDDELLDAAEKGDLEDVEVVKKRAEKMLDKPEARAALTRFFRDFMSIGRLDQIDKSPTLFPAFTATLGASMRTEIEMMFAANVFDSSGDFRDLFTTRETFVNDELATGYGISNIQGATFQKVTLPDDGHRAGLLTTPGFLAMNAHKTATSPTHRGRFIRLGLLCEDIAPPPPGVNTTLPAPDPKKPTTLRERLEEHRKNPTCAACHARMDPIGFGLEHYDALGQYRDTDNKLPVDSSSELDGKPFDGGVELGDLVAQLPEVGNCVARRFYQHATEHLDKAGEAPAVDALVQAFVASDYNFKQLVLALVVNDGFRYTSRPGDGQ